MIQSLHFQAPISLLQDLRLCEIKFELQFTIMKINIIDPPKQKLRNQLIQKPGNDDTVSQKQNICELESNQI